jgi:hypothetical protein
MNKTTPVKRQSDKNIYGQIERQTNRKTDRQITIGLMNRKTDG